jgi:hypothetical protein
MSRFLFFLFSLSTIRSFGLPARFGVIAPLLDSSQIVKECSDFTGNWKGTCATQDIKVDASTTINQMDCNRMGIVGIPYFNLDGSITTASHTLVNQQGDSGALSISSEWQAGKKVLVMESVSVTKSRRSATEVTKEKTVLFLDNGTLKWSVIIGTKPAWECQFSKQP